MKNLLHDSFNNWRQPTSYIDIRYEDYLYSNSTSLLSDLQFMGWRCSTKPPKNVTDQFIEETRLGTTWFFKIWFRLADCRLEILIAANWEVTLRWGWRDIGFVFNNWRTRLEACVAAGGISDCVLLTVTNEFGYVGAVELTSADIWPDVTGGNLSSTRCDEWPIELRRTCSRTANCTVIFDPV